MLPEARVAFVNKSKQALALHILIHCKDEIVSVASFLETCPAKVSPICLRFLAIGDRPSIRIVTQCNTNDAVCGASPKHHRQYCSILPLQDPSVPSRDSYPWVGSRYSHHFQVPSGASRLDSKLKRIQSHI